MSVAAKVWAAIVFVVAATMAVGVVSILSNATSENAVGWTFLTFIAASIFAAVVWIKGE